MGNNSKSKITPYLYLVPCMLIFGIFLFYPFVKTIYLSLYKTNKMGQAKLYVGLGNYKELLQSASFINSRFQRNPQSYPNIPSQILQKECFIQEIAAIHC